MNGKKKGLRIVDYKFIYSILIGVVYLIGKSIPLMGIDVSVYENKLVDADNIFMQAIGGDINRCSLLALGISPYMLAGIITQVATAWKKADEKSKVSPKRMNRYTIGLTFLFAVGMAIFRVRGLVFNATGYMLLASQIVAGVELVTGAMIILWLADRNKQFGIGGQTALIFMNVIDGIMANIFSNDIREVLLPLGLGFVAMLSMMIMENSEKRINVQRISIHNIYSDKNYIAIKLNPIGVMPAMFSTAFFMIPQFLCTVLVMITKGNPRMVWLEEQMSVTKPIGMITYLIILYVLTVVFSIVFISPRDLTENLLKSGDCIPGLHAGKDTKRYLKRTLAHLGLLSATVMSVCLGIPMLLQSLGFIHGALVMLPTSMMMLTGISCNLNQEIKALRHLDSYEPFI